MMEAIKVSFELKSPLIFDMPISLDALLAFALYQETDDLHVAHEELPLKRTGGVWHASQIRMEGPVMYQSVDFSMSLKESDMDKRLFAPGRSNRYSYIDQVRGEHKANLDRYPGLVSKTNKVHFFAFGDKEKIEALLRSNVFSLGKKHQQGYGSISSLTVESADDDFSLYHPEMGVMRPIPIDLVLPFEISSQKTASELTAFAPPYYQTEQKLCYVPSSIVYTAMDIEQDEDDFF